MLLTVTSETWLITGLGFGMVLVLLFVFIYIMKFLGWIMQPRQKAAEEKPVATASKPSLKPSDATANDLAAIAMALALNENDEEKAAVAFALHLYYNSIHDIEAPQLTIRLKPTMWNKNLIK